MFSALGNIITVPFAALMRWLYALTGSYGISIILFGLVVKLVVLPFQMKSKRSMVRMSCRSSTPKISRNIRRSCRSSTRRRGSTPWAVACGPSCPCSS